MVFSIPLLPGAWDLSGPKTGINANQPVSLKMGAKGLYNPYFQKLAENLVSYGLGDSILRMGWEFNGGWYTWRASSDPANFAEYWRQIVTTMRAVPGAKNLKFDWNPALGWQQFPAEQAWPGDKYADIKDWMFTMIPGCPILIPHRRIPVQQILLNSEILFWTRFFLMETMGCFSGQNSPPHTINHFLFLSGEWITEAIIMAEWIIHSSFSECINF